MSAIANDTAGRSYILMCASSADHCSVLTRTSELRAIALQAKLGTCHECGGPLVLQELGRACPACSTSIMTRIASGAYRCIWCGHDEVDPPPVTP